MILIELNFVTFETTVLIRCTVVCIWSARNGLFSGVLLLLALKKHTTVHSISESANYLFVGLQGTSSTRPYCESIWWRHERRLNVIPLPVFPSLTSNTNLLPPKPKSTFRHLKQGIQDFHRKYVLVAADKAANNVVVVWRLHYINTLKQELSGTKAYKENSEEETSVVNGHWNHLAPKFSVCVKERQDILPTMYWLPKLHKRPYKARFIANSSSCTTTELSKLLTSCLIAVKNHVIR